MVVHCIKQKPEPWYSEGLRFECIRCGSCCRGPGIVWISPEECSAIAEFLGLPQDVLIGEYLLECEHGFVLRDRLDMGCVMLDGDRCIIYPARPLQCRSYPFWAEILESRDAWLSEASRCPGINRGRLWSFREIRGRMLK
ncbi:MAG TPA: YkgJ family cysteine cluster protein [Methanothrix sp.]|nr:YkgJ family cysteine cluster protein [Methanothrix sp.]HOK58835.1 YkgJ family cysteine cluster protein [Methanothrix sp.]HOL42783.1 YkgJ family cysteine cluster protein [Methanothrix sp.]HPO89042.1 YkgJ family cysteine cluster protein [Methanothrix sp.]